MDKSDFRELKDVLDELRSTVQEIRTAINGNDLGTPGLATELRRHSLDDDRQFSVLREQQRAMAEQQSTTKLQIARWGGGLAVLVFACGLAATLAAAWHQ